MELDSATMAGESKKAACDWVPPTPLKSAQERRGNDSAAGGGGGGAGVVARKVSFAVPENPSSSNIGNFGINRKPECIIIDKQGNAGCEFGANPMKASNEVEIVTPEKKKERKKRVKVKKHRPRVLDKFKTKKKPSTPKPTKPSTPKPRTPKRPKLADKNTISNNTPVLLPKRAHLEELGDSNENICRRKLAFDVENHSTADQSQKASVEIESKLDFDIENQSTTDQSQKASDEIANKPEVGDKLHECLKNSRKVGPTCPGVLKKARTRRPRATTFHKFFRIGSLPPTTQTKNNSVMNELMGLGPTVSNRLTRSQTREAVKHPDFEKCRTNSQWKGKRKRSKMLARIRYLSSFVKDISKLQFSETFILKASAIRIKDISSEIPVAHVEAQNEGVLNLDKSELIENQKLLQDNVVSGNDGIHDSEDRKSIEQQELHPNNVDYCHESSQICLEDFEDHMVGFEMSVDACRRIPTFLGPSENKDGEVVVVVDVLDSHNYDWFTKGVLDYIIHKMKDLRTDECEEKPKKHKPKMDLDMDLVMLSGENKDAEAEYWARERALFEGRIDEFIAIMNILQGKKLFSPWKGSVLDSVIGVLLTQNVNDKFSSAAYMNVSSRFPVVSHDRASCGKKIAIEMNPTSCLNSPTELNENQPESISSHAESIPELKRSEAESIPSSEAPSTPGIKMGKGMKKVKKQNQENMNWDELRMKYASDKSKKRSEFTADSVNWEAVRETSVEELATVIKDRGMSKILANRMKNFLNRILRDHGALDLEWLRDVPPEKAKEYLLSFDGLGLKSVECVRLLELHCTAFPVDVNIARIATRLNWVNLHALPEGVQIHDLNNYPSLDSVQKFLAPRVSHISHAKLYQFHCHLMLFGKALCAKRNPNCGPCPLKTRCKHYASKHGRPLLEDYPFGNKRSASSQESQGTVVEWIMDGNFIPSRNSNPIIETPESPVRESSEPDLEDLFKNEDDEYDEQDKMLILNLSRIGREEDMRIGREEGMSKALARIIDSSHPVIKLKELQRLRTIHQVYELPDSHPLLAGFDKRDEADLCPYLLAIWIPGMPGQETTKKIQNNSEEGANLGDIVKYQYLGIIKGTILIPCRTANRGSFPLNGTYFQPNQVFADDESSLQPILIKKESVCNLKRRVLYCSTSLHSICNGMKSTYELTCFFNIAFMCVNGFDRKKMKPTQLHNQFHIKKNQHQEPAQRKREEVM